MKLVRIEFGSTYFDVEHEPPNDINPVKGQSFLVWLGPLLESEGYVVEGPYTEDWGWYSRARTASGRYIIGAMAMPEGNTYVAWYTHVRRERSLAEVLRRKGRITQDDLIVRLIERHVKESAAPDGLVVWEDP
jgi:hypothetical protein